MKERIINIGPRLKQRRKEMRIKQTEMAKELGVSQTYLSNYVRITFRSYNYGEIRNSGRCCQV